MTEKEYPPPDMNPPGTSSSDAYPPPYSAGYSEQQLYPPQPSGQPYPPQAYPPEQPYPTQQYAQQQPYPTQQYAQPPAYGADPQAYPQQQSSSNVAVVAYRQPTVAHHAVVTGAKPPNYIALSLINLLCCCWPLGIVGLVYSLKVDSEFNAGRLSEAQRASETARTVNYIGIGLGTVLIILYVVIIIVANVASAASSSSS
ncbi:cell death-inducing p53-target protein 1 homolog [Dysidea avara]|uniref:cell death-inducing p53-target protein 1 homolog n=1 Tax=Dysidea avara TaxID=196820 RepID=UPI00332A65F0